MLRMWVFTVFTESDSSPAISGQGQVRRQVAQHLEFARAELLRRRHRGLPAGRHGRAVQDVKDVGQQRSVSCLVGRYRLEQFP